jgi:hypothetical protein
LKKSRGRIKSEKRTLGQSQLSIDLAARGN